MNEHEIEIYNINDRAEIDTITTALEVHNIAGENIDEIGTYLHKSKPDSVFVECSELEEAVNIINALGYETDEDDNEPSISGLFFVAV